MNNLSAFLIFFILKLLSDQFRIFLMYLKYIGIQYIGNYHILNSAMGAYYNSLGVYNMGAHFLVTLKSWCLLEHGLLLHDFW